MNQSKVCLGKVDSSSSLSKTMEELYDDNLINILFQLPVENVHRLKCVSKKWNALISESWFGQSYTRSHSGQTSIGNKFLVYPSTLQGYYEYVAIDSLSTISYCDHQNLPNRQSGRDKFLNFSPYFLSRKLKQYERIDIVGISQGLLLHKLISERIKYWPRGFEGNDKTPKNGVYYISNPLTRQWLKIPRAPRHWHLAVSQVGFMCYTLNPYLSNKTEFVVLEVECNNFLKDEFFYAHVFSSLTKRREIYCVECPSGFIWDWPCDINALYRRYNHAVVYQGKFHWSSGSHIIAYDPLNEPYKCNLIPFPGGFQYVWPCYETEETYSYSCVDVIGGNIHGAIRISNEYHISELIEYEKKIWCFKYRIHIDHFGLVFFSQINGNHVGFKKHSYPEKLSILEVDNQSSTEVLDHFDQDILFVYEKPRWPTAIPLLSNK